MLRPAALTTFFAAFGFCAALAGDSPASRPAVQMPPAGQATPEYQVKNTPTGDAALEMMKALVGTWTGTTAAGQPVKVSYRTISNGTCVEETIRSHDATDMVSVYCPDRDGLMMTHYCAANNQPRMRAKMGGDPNRLEFRFVDATNLDSPTGGHMSRMVLTLAGRDAMTQEWTWTSDGKDGVEVFKYQRAGS